MRESKSRNPDIGGRRRRRQHWFFFRSTHLSTSSIGDSTQCKRSGHATLREDLGKRISTARICFSRASSPENFTTTFRLACRLGTRKLARIFLDTRRGDQPVAADEEVKLLRLRRHHQRESEPASKQSAQQALISKLVEALELRREASVEKLVRKQCVRDEDFRGDKTVSQ